MSRNRPRTLYARWDIESTKALIRLILTDDDLKFKMLSLIDKHYHGSQPNSAHLGYGSVKKCAERIGFLPNASRGISIKMINIVKSFNRKHGLFQLFTKGWEVASRLEKQNEDSAEKSSSKGLNTDQNSLMKSSAFSRCALRADQQLFERIIEEVCKRVMTYTRSPTAHKIRKENRVQNQLPVRNGQANVRTQRQVSEQSIEARSLVQNGSQFEFQENSENKQLHLGDDQLSRAEMSQNVANEDFFEAVNERRCVQANGLPVDVILQIESSKKQIRAIKDSKRRRDIEKVIETHLKIISGFDPQITDEDKRKTTKLICEWATSEALGQNERNF